MKLTDLFLTEETLIAKHWKVTPVEIDNLVEILNAHCKMSLKDIKNKKILWRGMNDIGESAILDSTDSYRTSRDTSNLYQLMMESSENMKHVPLRSKSFICVTSKNRANAYSNNVYALIPYDGVQIGVSSSFDILRTRLKEPAVDLDDFSRAYTSALYALGIYPDDSKYAKYIDKNRLDVELSRISPEMAFYIAAISANFSTSSSVEKFFKTYNENVENQDRANSPKSIIEQYYRETLDSDAFEKALKLLIKTGVAKKYFDLVISQPHKRFTNLASLLMTPENLGISVTMPGNIETERVVECWFSGKCVAVKAELLPEILKKINK